MNKKNIAVFTALAFALIWSFAAIFRLCGGEYESIYGLLFASACMFVPLLTVLIMQLINREKPFSNCGIRWKVNFWWFFGWLLMPVISILALAVSCLMPGIGFSTSNEMMAAVTSQLGAAMPTVEVTPFLAGAITVVSGLFTGITFNALFSFGEEIGWRGWLLRQFKGARFLTASVMIGVIWGFWHAPLILMGHNYPSNPVAGVFMMVAMCVALTPILQYVRLKSRSVIVAAIMHGTLNAVAGLTILYVTGYNEFLAGCTGVAGILVMLAADLCLFLYDRYVSRERLFTSVL